MHLILNAEISGDIKLLLIFLLSKIDFKKDIYIQYIELSSSYLQKINGLCDKKCRNILKNCINDGYLIYKKGGYEIKNSPNSYCLTPKIFEEYEQKIEELKEIQMENISMWCRDLAVIWVDWRRSLGLENACPFEEYAYHIADAYHLIPNEHDGKKINKEEWMNHIFDLIISDDYWKNACSTPHQLKEKAKGAYKIQRLFTQATSKKNLIKIKLKELEKDGSPEIIF